MPAKTKGPSVSCVCGTCRKCYKRQWARMHPSTEEQKRCKREHMKEWRANNLEKSREWVKRWQAANPEKVAVIRRRRYGMKNPEIAPQLEELQGGKCAICPRPGTRADHDHETGMVRGMLCDSCNLGLGKFRDDPGLLASAFAYLIDPPANRLKYE